jgi:hypothetical protein
MLQSINSKSFTSAFQPLRLGSTMESESGLLVRVTVAEQALQVSGSFNDVTASLCSIFHFPYLKWMTMLLCGQ